MPVIARNVVTDFLCVLGQISVPHLLFCSPTSNKLLQRLSANKESCNGTPPCTPSPSLTIINDPTAILNNRRWKPTAPWFCRNCKVLALEHKFEASANIIRLATSHPTLAAACKAVDLHGMMIARLAMYGMQLDDGLPSFQELLPQAFQPALQQHAMEQQQAVQPALQEHTVQQQAPQQHVFKVKSLVQQQQPSPGDHDATQKQQQQAWSAHYGAAQKQQQQQQQKVKRDSIIKDRLVVVALHRLATGMWLLLVFWKTTLLVQSSPSPSGCRALGRQQYACCFGKQLQEHCCQISRHQRRPCSCFPKLQAPCWQIFR